MRSFLRALLIGSVVACSSKNLPPVAPEDVKVFMPGVPTPFEYDEIWRSNDSFATELSDEVIEKAKKEAGKRGADAVLFYRRSTRGAVSTDVYHPSDYRYTYRIVAVLITKPKV